MTDQADTPDPIGRPGETEAVEAAHRVTCHVPNCVARFDAEVAVDAAYPIIAEAVRADTADEVRALRAENERLTEQRDAMIWAAEQLQSERDSALAELAAARDREAAVRSERNRLAIIARQLMHGLTPKAEAERLIAAALSQSEPTKERSE